MVEFGEEVGDEGAGVAVERKALILLRVGLGGGAEMGRVGFSLDVDSYAWDGKGDGDEGIVVAESCSYSCEAV